MIMKTIIVTDIFGKTPALVALSKSINAHRIIDPYHGVDMAFDNEAEAYSYFLNHVGFENYFFQLQQIIKSNSSATLLIGFSIGATAIWRLSKMHSIIQVKRGICYYGSQIRYFRDIEPRFPIELIFPNKEPHFNVLKLQTELIKKDNVKIYHHSNLHGFMNPYSTNFNQQAYQEQLIYLGLTTKHLVNRLGV